MGAFVKNHVGWNGRAMAVTTAGIAGFALLGYLLSLLSYPLFGRLGLASLVVVIAAPFVAVVILRAVPELFRGARALRRNFGWQEWCWALLFLGGATFAVRNVNETLAQPLNGWASIRIGSEMIVAVILASRMVANKASLQPFTSGLFSTLGLYCLVVLVSTTWSIVPLWTFLKSGEYLLDVTVAVFIFSSIHNAEDYLKILNWTWVIYALETCIAWQEAVFSPATAWDDMGRLHATFPLVASNNIGTTGGVLMLVAISRLLWRDRRGTSRSWYWAVLIFGLASMLVAQTRNAIAGFVAGLLVLLILAKRKWILIALAGLGTPLLMLSPAGAVVETYLRRGQNDEAMEGLTGRMDWWHYAWQQVSFHPLTGLGAYAGGRFGVLAKVGNSEAAYLHSDWLEVGVGTSFWGVLALASAVIGTWWFLIKGALSPHLRRLERELAIECAAVMGLLTVHSFFNDELCWHPPLYFLAVLGYAELMRRRLKVKQRSFAPEVLSADPAFTPALGFRTQ
jgi:hypothetical protein